MMESIDVWTLHDGKTIFVTDMQNVPKVATLLPSKTPDKEALHQFDNWDDAMDFARELATQLGYEVSSHSSWELDDEDNDVDYLDMAWENFWESDTNENR